MPHDYGDKFFEEPCGNSTRLVIGPSKGQVNLLIELSTDWLGHPWYLLYLLLVPRVSKREPARYQAEAFQSKHELDNFLRSFQNFFECDGRHSIWIASGANDGQLVYDQHNVIYAYGPVDRYRLALLEKGFCEEEFDFPAPHFHGYREEFDADEDRLLSAGEWTTSPLQPGDDLQ